MWRCWWCWCILGVTSSIYQMRCTWCRSQTPRACRQSQTEATGYRFAGCRFHAESYCRNICQGYAELQRETNSDVTITNRRAFSSKLLSPGVVTGGNVTDCKPFNCDVFISLGQFWTYSYCGHILSRGHHRHSLFQMTARWNYWRTIERGASDRSPRCTNNCWSCCANKSSCSHCGCRACITRYISNSKFTLQCTRKQAYA